MFSITLNTDYQKNGFANINFPSLRSDEKMNSPSSHSGEFSIAYRSENVRRFSNLFNKIKCGKNIGNKVVAFYFSEKKQQFVSTEQFIETYTSPDGGELIIDKQNNISIYFKGRLYNRDELSKFIGMTETEASESRDSPHVRHTDYELIIILYKKFGFEHMLKLLNGHFSIVLLDNNVNNKNDELYIAVDPFASFPLFILETKMKSEDAIEGKSNLFGMQSRMDEKCYEISTECYSDKHIPIISGSHCLFHLSYKMHSLWEKSYFNQKYFHIDTPSIYHDNIMEIKQTIKKLLISSFEYQYKHINFPSQATENWSSPSLRSGESLKFSGKSHKERFAKIKNICDEFFGMQYGNVFISVLGINYLTNDHSTNSLEHDFQIREGLKNMVFYDAADFPINCISENIIYPFLDKSFFQFYMSIHPSIRFLYKENIILSSLSESC
jgi:hypothetical protein